MRQRCLHFTTLGGAVLLGLVVLCAGGCWEKIEYTGPDPATAPRRLSPPPPAEVPEAPQPADDVPPVLPPPREHIEEPPPTIAETPAAEEEPVGLPFDDFDEVEHDPLFYDEVDEVHPPETIELPPAAQAHVMRRAAWQLGSRFSLAALAHDRGLVSDSVAEWFGEARGAAETLDTFVDPLPAPAAAPSSSENSEEVHKYIAAQSNRIWPQLAERYGADHAALFELAVRSNVLQVLLDHAETLAALIAEAGARAELPPMLWQPLLDAVGSGAPPAEVRAAVRRMHADVERHLDAAVEHSRR